ncbi:DUF2628 domain-containing protein [Salinarimonas sp.]|uniref:DUF2628 domain-containing protein n=1 Tax=Salinarimonas sp. TaxID=2766526 RepID=UPI0032D96CC5
MRTYTVHLPRDAKPGDPAAYERATLVRDGFNWAAFFFSVLWMLWHRLWLAALLTLIVLVAFSMALDALGIAQDMAALASLLLASLIGLEASTLRRWTYARRGMPIVDVVSAPDHDAADALACRRFMDRAAAAASVPVPPPLPPRAARREEIAPFGFSAEGAR